MPQSSRLIHGVHPAGTILSRRGAVSRFAAGVAVGFATGLLAVAVPSARADDNPPAPAQTGAPATVPAPAPVSASSSPSVNSLFSADTWSVHEQSTVIEQWHYGFPAEYSGPESFQDKEEAERTFSASLFLDHAVWTGGEVIFNPEVFQGHGLSDTLGVAGYPNGEAVKSGFANVHPNVSRLFFRQVIGLGGPTEKLDDDVNQVAEEVDVDRLTFSVGTFQSTDFFDDNAYSHDSRTQFMNWALWESGAWDYPADALGFTGGFVTEWNTRNGTLRYGIFMEPSVANGPRLDHHLDKANGQILQYDVRYAWDGHAGTLRPFVFWNRADMGSYADAASQPYPEDIALTRAYRSKAGFGLSWDQALTDNLGVFARLSWDDGKTESFAFTEIDRSLATGVSVNGTRWGRPADVLGLAVAVNGLAPGHQAYLANGGTGLILGDGALSYAAEEDGEGYYDIQVCKWLWVTPDYQYIEHPGYNSARGGVSVYAIRAHVAF